MSDIINRVAEAINLVELEWKASNGGDDISTVECPDEVKARAAIEAMRELTPEMLDAAYAADAYWLHDTSEIRTEWNDEMSNVHRAIIDAALK